jgi:hypothetical protein
MNASARCISGATRSSPKRNRWPPVSDCHGRTSGPSRKTHLGCPLAPQHRASQPISIANSDPSTSMVATGTVITAAPVVCAAVAANARSRPGRKVRPQNDAAAPTEVRIGDAEVHLAHLVERWIGARPFAFRETGPRAGPCAAQRTWAPDAPERGCRHRSEWARSPSAPRSEQREHSPHKGKNSRVASSHRTRHSRGKNTCRKI